MPLLTQPDPHTKRRRPWLWALLGMLGAVLALLVGLFGWSWFRPVELRFLDHGVMFYGMTTPRPHSHRKFGWSEITVYSTRYEGWAVPITKHHIYSIGWR